MDLVRGLLLDFRQKAVGAGAERGRQTGKPARARPRLVVKVVADDAISVLEVAGDETPHVGEAVGDPDTTRTDLIGVEIVVGVLQRRVEELVAREAGLDDVRPAVGVGRPVGEALALKLLVEQVLVLVDEGGDAVAIEQLDGLLDRFEVRGVVLIRLGLDLFPDDAEAHRGEALVLEELRVVLVEAEGVDRVRGNLVDEVDADREYRAALVVDDPAALGLHAGNAGRGEGGLGRAGGQNGGDEAKDGEGQHGAADRGVVHGNLFAFIALQKFLFYFFYSFYYSLTFN